MVRFVNWRDCYSGSLKVIVDYRTQYRSRMGHNHECFALCLAKILSGPEINSFHTFLSGSICYDWCSCVATSD